MMKSCHCLLDICQNICIALHVRTWRELVSHSDAGCLSNLPCSFECLYRDLLVRLRRQPLWVNDRVRGKIGRVDCNGALGRGGADGDKYGCVLRVVGYGRSDGCWRYVFDFWPVGWESCKFSASFLTEAIPVALRDLLPTCLISALPQDNVCTLTDPVVRPTTKSTGLIGKIVSHCLCRCSRICCELWVCGHVHPIWNTKEWLILFRGTESGYGLPKFIGWTYLKRLSYARCIYAL